MNVYSTVMFILAGVMLIPALMLYRGRTGWLRSFKRGKYKDADAYSRLLGKAVFCIALSFAVSGLATLIDAVPIVVPLIILLAGIILTLILVCKKAREYYR